MTEQEEVTSNVPEHDAQQNEVEGISASHLEDNAGKEAHEGSPRIDEADWETPPASSPSPPALPPKERRFATHRYTREELTAIGADPALRRPPQSLEASEIYRELQESLFYDKAAAVEEDAAEIRLRPGGGRLPGADRLPVASAAKAIPAGPPGVAQPPPRDGGPSSWKDDSWRSPFKGSPSPPIRSRLVDDASAISPPSGLPGPPGLNLRRPPPEGPPGPDWHPRDQWRRGGPPQEWRGGFEEEEPASPRRARDARASQDLDRWGSSKLPRGNEEAWRAAGGAGRAGPRAAEWAAGGGRRPAPPAVGAPAGRGAPPPGFDAPPGLAPTKSVPKEVRPQPQDGPRNGKPVPAAVDAKPRGLEGDWRAAKEKGEGVRERPDEHSRRMHEGPRNDGRPEWMAGEEGTERMSKAERQRLEFEAERLRWQEERKKVGQTAQKAANAAMGELLDDDELEQMRREEMEAEKHKDTQAQENSEDQPSHLAEPETPPKRGSGPSAESTPLQPPPGFSPNNLFGDADDDPLDFTANLSFLDDNEQEAKPKGDLGASSRFARFFAMEQSPGASAEKPPAEQAPRLNSSIAQGLFKDGGPTPAPSSQAGAQALLQQLQAGAQGAASQPTLSQQMQPQQPPQQQQMQAQNQANLFEQLAQAASSGAALQKALPVGAAKTLEDIEGFRGLPPMSGIGAFGQQQQQQQQPLQQQQQPQQQLHPMGGPLPTSNPGNTLLTLLQANARSTPVPQGMGQAGAPIPSLAGGQPGLMRRPSEALSQPALDPLLAAFSAQMGVGQAVARQNMVGGNPLVQGLGQYGQQNNAQQGSLASLLGGPGGFPQNPGVNAAYNTMLPSQMLQQQQQQQQARVNGGTPLPGGLGAASYGLQQPQHQHAGGLQPNLATAAQINFAAQQQAQTNMNEHQQNIIQLLQQQRLRDLMAAAGNNQQAAAAEYLQRQQQAQLHAQQLQAQQLQQQHLQHLRNQQGQGVNQIQTMQLQMQLARLQQQQQLVRQQQAAAAVQQQQATPYSNGLERFFNTAAAPGIQRMPAVPNQVGQRPTALEELERQFAARR